MKSYIEKYDDALSSEECDALIEYFNSNNIICRYVS